MVEAMTDRHPWDLEDPAEILRQVNALCRFKLGCTIVAAVRLSDQTVTGAEVATERRLPQEHPYGSDLTREVAERLVPERWSSDKDGAGMSHVLITVVCRPGFVVPGAQEFDWLRAWRYSNHFRGAYDGDVFIMTPHGWTGTLDERAGFEPCLPGDIHLRLAPPA
jgi:hypothetical protein